MKKKELLNILLVSVIIFYSCSYIIPFVVYNQKESVLAQADLLFELKKFGISDDLQEIYVNKAMRFGDRITTIELVFSRETNFRNLVDSCKRNGWNIQEDNAQENELILQRDNFYIKIYNNKQNVRLKIWKI